MISPCEEVLSFGFDERAAAVAALHSATALYTAAPVVDALLNRIGWPDAPGVLFDPSCGDGSFLLRALMRLTLAPDDQADLDRVRGMEIHPGAVADARAGIRQLLEGRGWSSAAASSAAVRVVSEADFLVDPGPAEKCRLLVGNPPYRRIGYVPAYLQRIYRARVARYAQGDMMHAFLDRCADQMADDGVIALVLADRFLFNESAAQLRVELGRRVGIEHLARLDSSTSFYRPKNRRRGSPPRIHPVEVVFRRAAPGQRRLGKEPISPEINPSAAVGPTLGDVAEVRLAPWLGPKGIFVIDAGQADAFPGEILIPAVDTDDIERGADRLRPPTRFAIRTTREVPPSETLLRHLESMRGRMPDRGPTRPLWLPPETITLNLDRPSLLVPRIAKLLRAIPLPAGVLPLNHNLSVVAAGPGCSLEELRTLIMSESSQRWIHQHAARLEGGYLSITTKLLRRLPIRG